jgi:transmembrane sensor
MSQKLPLPIKRALEVEIDEASIQRMWRNVSMLRRSVPPIREVAVWVAIAAAVFIGSFVVFDRLFPAASAVEGARLLYADGREIEEMEAGTEEDGALQEEFDDGSRVELAPTALLSPLENGPHAVAFLLERGRVRFLVRAHGPRRWSIECGLATIEVVGTRFALSRSPSHLHVEVEEGVVLARGERVPDRVQKLVRGSVLDIDANPSPLDAVEPAVPAPVSLPSLGAAVAPPRSTTSPSPSSRVEETERTEAKADTPRIPPREAPHPSDELPAEPQHRDERPVDLLAQADEARVRGDYKTAAEILERFVIDHPDAVTAPAAAFTLGRIRMEQLDQPQAAASAFEQAMKLGVPIALREDCTAYLADAAHNAGDDALARRAAADYLARYPEGRHSARMREMTLK